MVTNNIDMLDAEKSTQNLQVDALADPGFGQGGGPQKFCPRFCRRSKAESGKRSEPILAGVQGPP